MTFGTYLLTQARGVRPSIGILNNGVYGLVKKAGKVLVFRSVLIRARVAGINKVNDVTHTTSVELVNLSHRSSIPKLEFSKCCECAKLM